MKMQTPRERAAMKEATEQYIRASHHHVKQKRLEAQGMPDYLFGAINRNCSDARQRALMKPVTAPATADGDKVSELEKNAERAMLWLSVIGVPLLMGIAVAVCLAV